MEILKYLPMFYDKFSEFILISARIGAFFYSFVLFKQVNATYRFTLTLTILTSLYVLMLSGINNEPNSLGLSSLINIVIQSLIGIMIAFILNIVFEVFLFAGQLISTQMGLSIAALIDPRYGMITSLSQFYLLTSIMLFFMLNGHIWVIKMLIDSFQAIGISNIDISVLLKKSISFSGIIFSSSVMLSIVVITINLLINISIALISKFSPQFNIFTVGIGIQLIIGFALLNLIYHTQLDEGKGILMQGMNYLDHMLRMMGNV